MGKQSRVKARGEDFASSPLFLLCFFCFSFFSGNYGEGKIPNEEGISRYEEGISRYEEGKNFYEESIIGFR
ncbi:MAG: hypothetical protein J6T94_08215 [Bacteroidaceae bacterium]|nr:hypothetical protein [Bacteroidaceae bacterium]